jgi:hypothetical protein
MKNVLLIIFSSILLNCFSQLEEDFETGIPANWTQWSGEGIQWIDNSTLGTNDSGCAIADFGSSSEEGSTWLQTPFMNLSLLANPEITLSAAEHANNFAAPEFSLWYDIGNGWVEINTGWKIISNGGALLYPNGHSAVVWNDLTYDLSSLSSETNIRFSFGAYFPNGGWVLLDNVNIHGTGSTTSIESQKLDKNITLYPNPAIDYLNVQTGSISPIQLSIYSIDGKKLKTIEQPSIGEGGNDYRIDLNELNSGVYMLHLTYPEETRSIKFQVQK